MNLSLYFRSETSMEETLAIFQQIAARLQGQEQLSFQLTMFQDLQDIYRQGHSLREELWETDGTQLWFRVKAQEENTDLYNIQFSLEVLSKTGVTLCQLFDSSYNPWPKEFSLSLQVSQLSQFDLIRQVLQEFLGTISDETDMPKNAIGNIESLLANGQVSVAHILSERCWKKHQALQTLPTQWWIYFCELRRTLLENLEKSSS